MTMVARACTVMMPPARLIVPSPKGEGTRKGQASQTSSAPFCMAMPAATVPMMTVTTGRFCNGRCTNA
ncbi:hypothetical protein D3C78_1792010 [compost metagenome]